jgi:hypothetical protein
MWLYVWLAQMVIGSAMAFHPRFAGTAAGWTGTFIIMLGMITPQVFR